MILLDDGVMAKMPEIRFAGLRVSGCQPELGGCQLNQPNQLARNDG